MRFNNIQICGRIGQDAKIVEHNNRRFVSFAVGVDDGYKDGQGVWVDRAVWYDCVSEQDRFLKVAQYLQKGREVFVEGKPSAKVFQRENQQPEARIRIQMSNITFGALPASSQRPAATPASTPAAAPADSDDLPF